MKRKKISRTCAVCGRKFKIILSSDGKIISGGQYFGAMEIPAKDSKIIKAGKSKILGHDVEIVRHMKTRRVYYWECEQCAGEDSSR